MHEGLLHHTRIPIIIIYVYIEFTLVIYDMFKDKKMCLKLVLISVQ